MSKMSKSDELNVRIKDYEEARKKQSSTMLTINRLQAKIKRAAETPSEKHYQKLHKLYHEGSVQSRSVTSTGSRMAAALREMVDGPVRPPKMEIGPGGAPSGGGKKRSHSSSSIGHGASIGLDADGHPYREGTIVAARGKGKGQTQWIMGTVSDFHEGDGKYDIADADDSSLSGKNSRTHYRVQMCNVIPLMDFLAKDAVVFADNDRVLALYPETTAFYAASVIKTSKKSKSCKQPSDYLVRFDEEVDDKLVPYRFVLGLPARKAR